MRTDIRMLCVTNWNAVLELRGWYTFHFPGREYKDNEKIRVADPDAIDAGMLILLCEIKLVARIKKLR